MPRFGSAILLAGGKSHRMGIDKQELVFDKILLVHDIIDKLKARFNDVIVATNRPDLYEGLDVTRVADNYPACGPLAGIEAGLRLAKSRYVYVLACDMPLIDHTFIDGLMAKLDSSTTDTIKSPAGYEGIATRLDKNRIQPLNAFYDKKLAAAIANHLMNGDLSLIRFLHGRSFLYLSEDEARSLSPDLGVFHNLNRPHDLLSLQPADSIQTTADRPNMTHIARVPIIRVKEEMRSVLSDMVIEEATLDLKVKRHDGKQGNSGTTVSSHTFVLLADRLDDFTYGWLFTNQFIQTKADIETIHTVCTDKKNNTWQTRVTVRDGKKEKKTSQEASPTRPDKAFDPLPIPVEQLFAAFTKLDKASHLFYMTGGTHVLALCDRQGAIVDIVQDISRHVALDKLIGKALQVKLNLSELILLASCRMTGSMVCKAIAATISVLASRSAVTTKAIALAQDHGIRLIGFVRNGRFNLYS